MRRVVATTRHLLLCPRSLLRCCPRLEGELVMSYTAFSGMVLVIAYCFSSTNKNEDWD